MSDYKQAVLKNFPDGFRVYLTEETGSTNDDLKAAALSGAPDLTVRIADRQVAGRGRQNRFFFSENGLYMSVLLSVKNEVFPFVTAAAAVAVAKAIKDFTDRQIGVKWVNDVYLDGKKVCGILCESVVANERRRVVVGIGVNLNTPEEAFPKEIRGIATSLNADRFDLAKDILTRLCRLLDQSAQTICDEYRALCFLVGRSVLIQKENGCRTATVMGLTESLALCVRYEDGSLEELIAGDVSVHSSDK